MTIRQVKHRHTSFLDHYYLLMILVVDSLSTVNYCNFLENNSEK